jgi:O-antigen ligase
VELRSLRLSAALALCPAALVGFLVAGTLLANNPLPLLAGAIGAPLVVIAIARPAWGLAAVLALIPLMSQTVNADVAGAGGSQPLRLLLPVLAAAATLQAVALAPASRSRGESAVTIAFLLVLAAVAISGLTAVDPRAAIKGMPELATAVIVFFGAMQLAHDRSARDTLLAGLLGGVLLASVVALHQLNGAASGGQIWVSGRSVERVQGTFQHPNALATYLASLIPLAAAVACSRSFQRWLRVVACLGGALALPALLFSYSRGPALGLAIGSGVWLLLVRPRLALTLGAAGAVLALVLAPSSIGARFSAATASDDLTLRSAIWRGALDVAEEHPVVGAGYSEFPHAYAQTAGVEAPAAHRPSIPEVGGDELPPSAHNEYLNVLAEQGFAGVLAFLAFGLGVMVALRRGSRSPDPLRRAICLGAGAGAATWAVRGLLDTSLFTDSSIALFALVGLAVAVSWPDRPSYANPSSA